MKILIPMAGEGSRFAKEGYQFPKPLIDVNGKPMIQRVVENLDYDAEYIFLVRKEHLTKYSGLEGTLKQVTKNNSKIVMVDSLTEGAACTALLAKEYINNEEDDSQQLIINDNGKVQISNKMGYVDGNMIKHNNNPILDDVNNLPDELKHNINVLLHKYEESKDINDYFNMIYGILYIKH